MKVLDYFKMINRKKLLTLHSNLQKLTHHNTSVVVDMFLSGE